MKSAGRKIVFIGPFGLEPKGTMRYRALPLAKALAARGHTVTVLIPPWDDPARAGQRWAEDGVEVINVALPPRLPGLFHLGLTWNLVSRALGLQPDVIHLFKPKAYAGLSHLALWGLKRLRRLSLRLVVDSDDWEQAWNDRLPYSGGQKRFFAWQERWGLGHADAVTVASRALEELVTAQTGRRQGYVFYIPNGYQPSLNAGNGASEMASMTAAEVRARWQIGDAPVVLLYTRFVEFSPERVVTLVREVAARLPQTHWLIVGQGFQKEEEALQSRLNRAGLGQNVHFAGWLPAEQLPAYFAAANAAIQPYDDTLLNRTKCSVKLMELLAAAVPVVAGAVGQNYEYIQHPISGILAPPEDDKAFAGALATLLQAPQTQQRLGRAAARRMRTEFAWSTLSRIAERAYGA